MIRKLQTAPHWIDISLASAKGHDHALDSSKRHYFTPRRTLTFSHSLAWMELFVALGSAFRYFEFEIYETDASDVLLAHDFFVPCPKMDSRGVRVKITHIDPQLRVN